MPTDPVTGLGDRAAFESALTDPHRAHGVAVVRLELRDLAGRDERAATRVAREVTAALAATVRGGDEVFRLADDEFAAIVGVNEEGEALQVARRLRAAAARVAGSVAASAGISLPRHV